jgi:hypothetical protein
MFCEVLSGNRHALVTTSPVYPTRVIPLLAFLKQFSMLTTAASSVFLIQSTSER